MMLHFHQGQILSIADKDAVFNLRIQYTISLRSQRFSLWYGCNQLALTAFEPQLGHAILLCSIPQFIHRNFKELYAESLLLPLPNAGEVIDLYHPFIPPTPAFLKRLSALMILSEINTISKIISAI